MLTVSQRAQKRKQQQQQQQEEQQQQQQKQQSDGCSLDSSAQLEELKGQVQQQQSEIAGLRQKCEEQHAKLEEQQVKLEEQEVKLEEQREKLEEQHAKLEEQEVKLEEQREKLEEQREKLEEQEVKLGEMLSALLALQQQQAEQRAVAATHLPVELSPESLAKCCGCQTGSSGAASASSSIVSAVSSWEREVGGGVGATGKSNAVECDSRAANRPGWWRMRITKAVLAGAYMLPVYLVIDICNKVHSLQQRG
uniref:Uncharacterized protein n=1 Tax=Tetradesmus obliquus TaxID=3088 RepID=A0A383V3T0_TETOB|eukprot:jgi/Sobl393_1/4556/SZX59442.1